MMRHPGGMCAKSWRLENDVLASRWSDTNEGGGWVVDRGKARRTGGLASGRATCRRCEKSPKPMWRGP